MNKKVVLRSAVVLAGLVLGAVSSAEAQPPQYTVTDLGFLNGNSPNAVSGGIAINAGGQVAGTSSYTSDYYPLEHAFLWSPTVPNGTTGSLIDLGDLTPMDNNLSSIEGYQGINDNGEVVGSAASTAGNSAFLWLPSPNYGFPAGMNQLVGLGGSSAAEVAFSINNRGQIAGTSYSIADNTNHAVYWNGANGIVDLFSNGYAAGINNNTQIVGFLATSTEEETGVAFLWDPVQGLSILTPNNGGEDTAALAINDLVQVVGRMDTPAGIHAFLWDPINGLRDLTPGSPSATASDVNNNGQIVGADISVGAVIWLNSNEYNLNNYIPAGSGWSLYSANSINNSGQITGAGVYSDNRDHAFLLTPISGGPAAKNGAVRAGMMPKTAIAAGATPKLSIKKGATPKLSIKKGATPKLSIKSRSR